MTCSTVKIGDAFAIVCSRGRRRPKMCSDAGCARESTKLCDYPDGKGTCDKPLCNAHAVPVGLNKDWCPDHQRQPSASPQQRKFL